MKAQTINLLNQKFEEYNQSNFIPLDPICIPHRFSKKQDIEISGLFAAVLAWGLRKTIINKCTLLMEMMDNSPHDFILNHKETDLKPFVNFKHRTFNGTDTLYFIDFLKRHYTKNESLESAFTDWMSPDDKTVENGLIGFHNYFFDDEYAPSRTRKHIATPSRKSACKRLNMMLRWFVRKDNTGVDFGIWETIKPSQLICPLDVHVDRQARLLSLIKRKQTDWKTAIELTQNLRKLDSKDPVKYDFALFGIGVMEK